MKYILMMNGTKANFAGYAKWSKKDMEANVAFMHAFNKQLKDGYPPGAKAQGSSRSVPPG